MTRDADLSPTRDAETTVEVAASGEREILTADVVVVGAALAGLVAARECARIGARVLVVGGASPVAEDTVPGAHDTVPDDTALDDTALDDTAPDGEMLEADSDGDVADRAIADSANTPISPLVEIADFEAAEFANDGVMAALVADLDLGDRVRVRAANDDWWLKLDHAVAPAPKGTLVGIPGSPLATDVARVLGRRGSLRAYFDRLRPILTIGRKTNLGSLVRTRMGTSAWQRLVAPVVAARFGDDPETVLVAAVSPALNAAMTRQGSLSGGVTEILAAANEPSASLTVSGGLHPVTDALVEGIRFLNGELLADVTATVVDEVANSDQTHRWRVRLADGRLVRARAVILAVDAFRARSLSAHLLGAAWQGWPAAHRDEVTTLTLDTRQLDGAPRGSGVLAYSSDGQFSRVVHDQTAGQAGHRHTVRLTTRTFGPRTAAADKTPAEVTADDAHWIQPIRALAAAEAVAAGERIGSLLGIEIGLDSIVDAVFERRLHPPSPAAQGQSSRADAFAASVGAHPGLAITGDWLTGPRADAVIAHAEGVAEEIRGRLVREGLRPPL